MVWPVDELSIEDLLVYFGVKEVLSKCSNIYRLDTSSRWKRKILFNKIEIIGHVGGRADKDTGFTSPIFKIKDLFMESSLSLKSRHKLFGGKNVRKETSLQITSNYKVYKIDSYP